MQNTELMGSVSALEKKTARQPELQVQEQVARVEKQIEAQTQQTAALETQMQGEQMCIKQTTCCCVVCCRIFVLRS